VSHTWRPLGYNIRPKRLHAIARESMARYGGQLPSDGETLLSFKGIGEYTAGAVLSFAFGQRAAILDTNVARVLFRVFIGRGDLKSHAMKRHLWDVSRAVLPHRRIRFQSALMTSRDLCTARRCSLSDARSCAACLEHERVGRDNVFPPQPRGHPRPSSSATAGPHVRRLRHTPRGRQVPGSAMPVNARGLPRREIRELDTPRIGKIHQATYILNEQLHFFDGNCSANRGRKGTGCAGRTAELTSLEFPRRCELVRCSPEMGLTELHERQPRDDRRRSSLASKTQTPPRPGRPGGFYRAAIGRPARGRRGTVTLRPDARGSPRRGAVRPLRLQRQADQPFGDAAVAAVQHADDDLLPDVTAFRQADRAVLDAGLERNGVLGHVLAEHGPAALDSANLGDIHIDIDGTIWLRESSWCSRRQQMEYKGRPAHDQRRSIPIGAVPSAASLEIGRADGSGRLPRRQPGRQWPARQAKIPNCAIDALIQRLDIFAEQTAQVFADARAAALGS
jgi:hypothetical protein